MADAENQKTAEENEPNKEPAAQPKAEAATSAAPRLAGGNTIGQAQKPTKAKITLAETPFNPTNERIDDLEKRLSQKSADLAAMEAHMRSLVDERDTLLGRVNRQSKVLAGYGIGDSRPISAKHSAEPDAA